AVVACVVLRAPPVAHCILTKSPRRYSPRLRPKRAAACEESLTPSPGCCRLTLMHWRIASGLQSGARQSAGRETVKTPLIVTTAVARAALAIGLTLGASSMSVAATFVYVSDADDAAIDSYTMDAKTGALTSVGKIEAGKTVMPMAVSPNKKFLYAVVRSQPTRVLTYAID